MLMLWADNWPCSCKKILFTCTTLTELRRPLGFQYVSKLCWSQTEPPFWAVSKELTPGQCSILEKHHAPSITSWLPILDSWQGNCMAICDVTAHSERRAKQICTLKHTHTHICIHTVPCPEIPLRCQSSLCPFTVPLFRKLKKEHLVHWPPSASVSELGGTGIASSLVWSQYENVQAWMPHVAQGIQIDLGSDFSPMLMFYTVS